MAHGLCAGRTSASPRSQATGSGRRCDHHGSGRHCDDTGLRGCSSARQQTPTGESFRGCAHLGPGQHRADAGRCGCSAVLWEEDCGAGGLSKVSSATVGACPSTQCRLPTKSGGRCVARAYKSGPYRAGSGEIDKSCCPGCGVHTEFFWRRHTYWCSNNHSASACSLCQGHRTHPTR